MIYITENPKITYPKTPYKLKYLIYYYFNILISFNISLKLSFAQFHSYINENYVAKILILIAKALFNVS